jgi:hypothetical protein
MICHSTQSIFVHIPKNAGQSIETVFLEHNELSWDTRASLLLRHNKNPKLGPKRLAHLLASDYTKYKYISEESFSQYFKFAVVRDPYSRMVSFYKYLGFSSFCSFDFFILNILDSLYLKEHWFLRPQTDFLYSDNQLLVDKIIKLDDLEAGFVFVSKKKGIDIKLKHVNKSQPKKRKIIFFIKKMFQIFKYPSLIKDELVTLDKNTSNWNPLVIDKINKMYSLDFELLDYDKIQVDLII